MHGKPGRVSWAGRPGGVIEAACGMQYASWPCTGTRNDFSVAYPISIHLSPRGASQDPGRHRPCCHRPAWPRCCRRNAQPGIAGCAAQPPPQMWRGESRRPRRPNQTRRFGTQHHGSTRLLHRLQQLLLSTDNQSPCGLDRPTGPTEACKAAAWVAWEHRRERDGGLQAAITRGLSSADASATAGVRANVE